jgi:hypothetical protein
LVKRVSEAFEGLLLETVGEYEDGWRNDAERGSKLCED